MANTWRYMAQERTNNAEFWSARDVKHLRENAIQNLNYRTPHYSGGWQHGDEPTVSTQSRYWRAFCVFAYVREGKSTAKMRLRLTVNPTGFSNGANAFKVRLASVSRLGESVTVVKSASAQVIELECKVNSPRTMLQIFEVQLSSIRGDAYASTADIIGDDGMDTLIAQTDLSAVYGASHFEIVHPTSGNYWYVGRISAGSGNAFGDYTANSMLTVHPGVQGSDGWPVFGATKTDCDMYYLGTAKLHGWSLYFEGAETLETVPEYNAGQPITDTDVLKVLNDAKQRNTRHIHPIYAERSPVAVGKMITDGDKFAGAYFICDAQTTGISIYLRATTRWRDQQIGTLTFYIQNYTRGTDYTATRSIDIQPFIEGRTQGVGALGEYQANRTSPGGWGGSDLDYADQFCAYSHEIRVQITGNEIRLNPGDEIRIQITSEDADLRICGGLISLNGGAG